MARERRRWPKTAQIALWRNTNVHLGIVSRQSQPLTPVSTHLPGGVAATNVALHHHLRLHVEYRPIHPRFVRLRTAEPDVPQHGQQVPRQSSYLVHRCRH